MNKYRFHTNYMSVLPDNLRIVMRIENEEGLPIDFFMFNWDVKKMVLKVYGLEKEDLEPSHMDFLAVFEYCLQKHDEAAAWMKAKPELEAQEIQALANEAVEALRAVPVDPATVHRIGRKLADFRHKDYSDMFPLSLTEESLK